MLVAGGDHTDGPGESIPLIGEGHIRLGDERDWGAGVISTASEDAEDRRKMIVGTALVVTDAAGSNNGATVDHGWPRPLIYFLTWAAAPKVASSLFNSVSSGLLFCYVYTAIDSRAYPIVFARVSDYFSRILGLVANILKPRL